MVVASFTHHLGGLGLRRRCKYYFFTLDLAIAVNEADHKSEVHVERGGELAEFLVYYLLSSKFGRLIRIMYILLFDNVSAILPIYE